jgi:lysosomal acid lipase/cholesteryl ester hydrolase
MRETAELCSSLPGVCSGIIELFADLDTSVDNMDRMMTYLTHIPSGAGYRNFLHYAQLIKSDKFFRYDYGAAKNQQKYGQPTPPEYPLENIKVPIAMFVGLEDELGDPIDCRWLHAKLGDNKVVFYKEYPLLGHMTFAIGKDMSFFQVDAMALLKQYSTNSF